MAIAYAHEFGKFNSRTARAHELFASSLRYGEFYSLYDDETKRIEEEYPLIERQLREALHGEDAEETPELLELRKNVDEVALELDQDAVRSEGRYGKSPNIITSRSSKSSPPFSAWIIR